MWITIAEAAGDDLEVTLWASVDGGAECLGTWRVPAAKGGVL